MVSKEGVLVSSWFRFDPNRRYQSNNMFGDKQKLPHSQATLLLSLFINITLSAVPNFGVKSQFFPFKFFQNVLIRFKFVSLIFKLSTVQQEIKCHNFNWNRLCTSFNIFFYNINLLIKFYMIKDKF